MTVSNGAAICKRHPCSLIGNSLATINECSLQTLTILNRSAMIAWASFPWRTGFARVVAIVT